MWYVWAVSIETIIFMFLIKDGTFWDRLGLSFVCSITLIVLPIMIAGRINGCSGK